MFLELCDLARSEAQMGYSLTSPPSYFVQITSCPVFIENRQLKRKKKTLLLFDTCGQGKLKIWFQCLIGVSLK